MTEFGHSSFFGKKPPTRTGMNLASNTCGSCGDTDSTVSNFVYDTDTNILTLTLNTGETWSVDLSELEIVDGNIDGASYDVLSGELTITSTVGGPYIVTIPTSEPYTVAKTLFVYENGNDTAALRERPDLGYAFPWTAIADAVAGDTVIVYPGIYTLDSITDDGARKLISNEVVLHLMAGAIIVIAADATSNPLFDQGNSGQYKITGNGIISNAKDGDIFTSSTDASIYDITLDAFITNAVGSKIYVSDFELFSLRLKEHFSPYSFLFVEGSLNSKHLLYKCERCVGGVDEFTYGIEVLGGSSIVDIDVNVYINKLGISDGFMSFSNLRPDTLTKVKANVEVISDGNDVSGVLMRVALGDEKAILNAELNFRLYGPVILFANDWLGKANIKSFGKVESHYAVSDYRLLGVRGQVNLEVDSEHIDTLGTVFSGLSTNQNITRSYLSGKLKLINSSGFAFAFGNPGSFPDPNYHVSLSNLKVYMDTGTNVNEALDASEVAFINVDNVQSNLLFNYGSPVNITAQGETFTYLPTLLL